MNIVDILSPISELCMISLMIIGVSQEIWFIAILGGIGFFGERYSSKLLNSVSKEKTHHD